MYSRTNPDIHKLNRSYIQTRGENINNIYKKHTDEEYFPLSFHRLTEKQEKYRKIISSCENTPHIPYFLLKNFPHHF